MGRLRFTKGELKKQRDALRQYQRYLPTLQLKKQQLQIEILRQVSILEQKEAAIAKERNNILRWAGLLVEEGIDLSQWLKPQKTQVTLRNIAGVDFPVFERAEFISAEYDLFIFPLWVDAAIDALRGLVSLLEEAGVLAKGIAVLRQELRVTTQRVNLFEKVKIPEAQETIRLIKIYIGDQLSNAVGRSKAAKRKIEAEFLQGVAV